MTIKRRKRLADGSFGELEKVFEGETESEKVERLEEANAEMAYNSMMKDMELESLKDAQAEVMYQLMMNGVI